VDIVSVDLWGLAFTLIGAGPLFQFNPSVSFLVAGSTKEEISELWGKLSQGGSALMELGEYPFSEKYGWVQDKYGLSWQIVPAVMDEMMKDKDKNGLARVTETFLKMKKFDIEALKRAYRGKK
jgi:predicted 3-demethylubiquinone-9 3-methyltransferase (glyoxalase superfamily)